MASGASYVTLRDTQGGVSSSTVCRCVHEFVKFLCAHSRKFIRFPKVKAGSDMPMFFFLFFLGGGAVAKVLYSILLCNGLTGDKYLSVVLPKF